MQAMKISSRREGFVAPRLLAFFAVLALPWLGLGPARAADTAAANAAGWWLNAAGTAAIVISPCGNEMCGRIEWLKPPLNEQGQPKTDTKNPNQTLRGRYLCGLSMLGGFTPDGAGGWKGGWVYDPKVGKTYKAVMHVAPDGTLRLRGYVGIPMFGRSETMTRPAAPLTPCTPPAGAAG